MNRFCIVDFETTGSHPRQGDSIIQIGAVTVDDGVITHRFSTFVKPDQPIPPFIASLTGITDEMVESAPVLEEVLPELLRLLDDRVFVAHNAYFDLHFLQEALLSQGYYTFDGPVLDTVELARILLPIQGGYRLIELADDLDIQHENPHQADSDAEATAHLLIRFLELLEQLPLVTIQRLQMLVTTFRSDISSFLRHIELEKMLQQSESDKADGQWDVYRQFALKKRETADPGTESREPVRRELSDPNEWSAVLKTALGDYQQRDAQLEMMNAIHQAMQDGAHLMVEAGTGTGKSLGYLLPAIHWAREHQEKVLISTHTITLQEQLFENELPRLREALPFSFTAAKMKGRGNYLCLRKFEQHIKDSAQEYSHEIQLAKAQMLIWLTQTSTGDIEELNVPPAGQLFWQQVKSDASSCLNRRCPWFSRCYYFQAKEQARDADLVIVNHALLLNDLETESGILPSYQVGIIDEAHQLEEAATQHMGLQYSTVQLQFLIDRLQLDSPERQLVQLLQEWGDWRPGEMDLVRETERVMLRLHAEWREAVQLFTQLLYDWASKQAAETNEIGRASVRYRRGQFQGKRAKILEACERVVTLALAFAKEMEQIVSHLANVSEERPPYIVGSLLTDTRGLVGDTRQAAERLHILFLTDDPLYVNWLELESRTSRKHVYAARAPLDVAEPLVEKLFDERRSLTLTSATLTVKNRFDYMLERYGLDRLPPERVRTLSLPSPFDYRKQGLVLIPSDFPALGKETEQQYLEAVIQGAVDVIRASAGRTMILFTSYSMLRQVYEGLKEQLEGENFFLLGHGIDSSNRTKLIKKFQEGERTVLLGTNSFWEGVDVPGDDLSSLVIVRLPFLPPNHPVLEARSERLKELGRNPFMTLSLPHAIIRFKQGVGRLIRHHQDRGVVVIFDTRVIEARYGRSFLQSLPSYQMESGPWTALREQIAPFLRG